MTDYLDDKVKQLAAWIIEDIEASKFASASAHLKDQYYLLSNNLSWMPLVTEAFSNARKDDPQAATTYLRILWYQNSNIELLDDALSVCINLQSWHNAALVLQLIEAIPEFEFKLVNTLSALIPRIIFSSVSFGYHQFLLSISSLNASSSAASEIAFFKSLGNMLLGRDSKEEVLRSFALDLVAFQLCKAAIALMQWNRTCALGELSLLRNTMLQDQYVGNSSFSLACVEKFEASIVAENVLHMSLGSQEIPFSGLIDRDPHSRNDFIMQSLQSASFDNAFIIRGQNAVYVKSEKSACTSLLYMVWRLNGGPIIEWESSDASPLGLLHLPSAYLPKLSDLPLNEQLEILTNPNWFVFSFLRNPVSRFLSSFQDKFLRESNSSSFYPFRRSIRFLIDESWSIFDEFEMPIDVCAFARAVLSLPFQDLDDHFCPQFLRLRANVINYNFLGRISSAADWAFLADSIGWQGDVPRLNPHSSNIANSKLLLRRIEEGDLYAPLVDYYSCDSELIREVTSRR
jgi:hypothetical protein